MATYLAHDGTEIAYRVRGTGNDPVVCLPGGMQASTYFGDLGGLPKHRQVVMVDLRGTGLSAEPADAASYRCDLQAADVEALREHLGLDRLDLLGHSGGANLLYRYAADYPERVGRLVLVAPSPRGLGIDVPPEARARVLERRKNEPWYPEVAAAFAAIQAGQATEADWSALAPMAYGRWDEIARAHSAAQDEQTNHEAFRIYNEEGAFDPVPTRARLAALQAPTLVVAGEMDWSTPIGIAEEIARVFSDARLVVLDGAGHMPWMDDPHGFTSAVGQFLG